MSIPIGGILASAESSPSSGWLLCDGAAVSRTAYAALFAAIGTTYGVGDGSTTFNVPDLRGRIPVGSGSAYSDGDAGGVPEHALAVGEMPSHTHQGAIGGAAAYDASGSTDEPYSSTTTEVNTGEEDAHNNVMPYIATSYFIFAGA